MHSIGFDENDIKQITIKVSNQKDLFDLLGNLLTNELNYFYAMLSKQELGNIIKIASKEKAMKILRQNFLN